MRRALNIRSARLRSYRLPLRDLWSSAGGGFALREGGLLRLETEDGRCGYGDCAPLALIGTESLAQAKAVLRERLPQMIGTPANEALAALPLWAQTPAARCALECALLDLQAQASNLALRHTLSTGTGTTTEVQVNAALGGLMSVNDNAILSACTQGFSVLKLKVGRAPLNDELDRLRSIAALLPAHAQLRLDANRAWNEVEATCFVANAADLPIEMLEEPLADPQPAALRRLQANCTFSLALDESWPGNWPTGIALDAFFAAPPVRRLVLKPPRLGGLLPALAMARRARSAGMECVVTSSVESACGVLAAAQLAAVLEGEQDSTLAHGLATSSWLAEDLGAAPVIVEGRLRLPATVGLGFVPLSSDGF